MRGDRKKEFEAFRKRIENELLSHRIIRSNAYTAWFRKGEMSIEQLKAFLIQFSVFSNLFLLAQLYKMINADSLEGMHASKEILANEIGVVFNSDSKQHRRAGDYDQEGDPELVSTEGTVEGGTFHFKAAHFEWFLRIAKCFDLGFNDIGKRRHGTKSTLFFCDELVRLYGSPDYSVGRAASFAVENWAAAGFWKELVEGLAIYKKREKIDFPLAFFTWHDRIESQHAKHTQEELEEDYFAHTDLDEMAFLRSGNEMLEGVAAFWDGLEEDRKKYA